MTSPDPPAARATPGEAAAADPGATRPSPPDAGERAISIGAGVLVVLLVLLLVSLIGMLGLLGSFTLTSPYPELARPAGSATGALDLRGPTERSVIVTVELSEAARAAATETGDGTVYLELDLIDPPADQPIRVSVVRRDDPGAVLSDTSVEPGADVRWTMTCLADRTTCGARYEIVFAADPGAAPAPVGWRMSAEIRPRRGAEVAADATISVEAVGP